MRMKLFKRSVTCWPPATVITVARRIVDRFKQRTARTSKGHSLEHARSAPSLPRRPRLDLSVTYCCESRATNCARATTCRNAQRSRSGLSAIAECMREADAPIRASACARGCPRLPLVLYMRTRNTKPAGPWPVVQISLTSTYSANSSSLCSHIGVSCNMPARDGVVPT